VLEAMLCVALFVSIRMSRTSCVAYEVLQTVYQRIRTKWSTSRHCAVPSFYTVVFAGKCCGGIKNGQ